MLIELDPEGAPALIAELVTIFDEDAPKRIQEIEEGLQKGIPEDVSGAAHALKGGVSNLGLARMAAIAKDIERFGRDKNLEAVVPLVPKLKEAFVEALQALKDTYLKG